MVGLIGGRSSAFDYIGPNLPDNPQNGEMWFDTDGASDGTGEVKVYDGASGSWEATGFTSHADLTDVTRGAHHPPVDVSGPLTQPSDQSLGLSIGDGLANSAGTLVAALGNGLGIDADGNVYVPAGALSHGAEVDTPTDAHHTRYTDSEARAATDGVIDADTVDGQHASALDSGVLFTFAVNAGVGQSPTGWTSSDDFNEVNVLPVNEFDTLSVVVEWTYTNQNTGNTEGVRIRDTTNGVTLASDTSGGSGTLDTTVSIPSNTGRLELQAINEDDFGGVQVYNANAYFE